LVFLADLIFKLTHYPCPLNVFKPGSRHVCRDETLVMALIAGIQNGDEQTIHYCWRSCTAMTGVIRRPWLPAASRGRCDYTMRPIQAYVVARILSRTPAKTLDDLRHDPLMAIDGHAALHKAQCCHAISPLERSAR